WGSPCGNTMMLPASSSTGASGAEVSAAQQLPRVTMWYSIRVCAAGMMRGTSSSAAGASAAHGGEASMSKNTAPLRRTACNTVEITSVGMMSSVLPAERAREMYPRPSLADSPGRTVRHPKECKKNQEDFMHASSNDPVRQPDPDSLV